jgi:hypothetical protein
MILIKIINAKYKKIKSKQKNKGNNQIINTSRYN